jgi:CheY-like chemotaxis protein
MPNMDGIEFLEKIREEAISDAPVIICTGVSAETLPHLDIFAMFEKPVDRKSFIEKVNRAFYFGKNKTTIMSRVRRTNQLLSDHELLQA